MGPVAGGAPGRQQGVCAAAGPWGSRDARLPLPCCDCLGLPRAWPPWAQEQGGLTSFPSLPLRVVPGSLQGTARGHQGAGSQHLGACPLSLPGGGPEPGGPSWLVALGQPDALPQEGIVPSLAHNRGGMPSPWVLLWVPAGCRGVGRPPARCLGLREVSRPCFLQKAGPRGRQAWRAARLGPATGGCPTQSPQPSGAGRGGWASGERSRLCA